MFNIYFFDLDGTLTDSGLGITNSVRYTLKEYNREVGNVDLYKFVGPPLKDSFKKYYGFKDEELDKVVETYRVYFKTKGMFENSVYLGVSQMLEGLRKKNKKIYVVTSKPEEFAITILKHFDLFKYFDMVFGSTMDGSIVKKEDIIKLAIDNLKISNINDVVMVGDRDQDINGANINGIKSIGVTYGYGSKEELLSSKATYIVDNVEDILEI